MKKSLIAAVVALFVGAVITDVFFRFFAASEGETQQYFSLFILLTLGILLANLVTAGASSASAKNTGKAVQHTNRGRTQRQSKSPRKRSNSSSGRAPKRSPEKVTETATSESEAPVNTGPRETGSVKWFNRNKGFGFLVRENGDEIFVHFRAIRDPEGSDSSRKTLKDGQKVSFTVIERDKGPQADDVAPL